MPVKSLRSSINASFCPGLASALLMVTSWESAFSGRVSKGVCAWVSSIYPRAAPAATGTIAPNFAALLPESARALVKQPAATFIPPLRFTVLP